jgi:hypothetical protein
MPPETPHLPAPGTMLSRPGLVALAVAVAARVRVGPAGRGDAPRESKKIGKLGCPNEHLGQPFHFPRLLSTRHSRNYGEHVGRHDAVFIRQLE